LKEALELNATGKMRVDTMLIYSRTKANAPNMDFDRIVTNDNMRKILEYCIPKNNILYDKKGKNKASKKSVNERVMLGSIVGTAFRKKGVSPGKTFWAKVSGAASGLNPPKSQKGAKKVVALQRVFEPEAESAAQKGAKKTVAPPKVSELEPEGWHSCLPNPQCFLPSVLFSHSGE
jgi:hypothetical protein